MFTSSADVFRTRQAIRDLIDVVRSHRHAMLRLGGTKAGETALIQIISLNGRITQTDDRIYRLILLAAALPDDDFPCFVTATALLLANRLQDSYGTDDLYWNWDAFRDHYRLADPPVRAALMNGYRTLSDKGRLSLDHAPASEDCLSRAKEDVVALLDRGDEFELLSSIQGGISPSDAGRLWQVAVQKDLSWLALMGFRYLYERPRSIDPQNPQDVKLIPWT